MRKLIEFPQNNQTYLKRAQQAVEEDRVVDALDNIEKILESDGVDESLHVDFFELLVTLGLFDLSEQMFKLYYPLIDTEVVLENVGIDVLYIHMHIYQKQFDKAQELIDIRSDEYSDFFGEVGEQMIADLQMLLTHEKLQLSEKNTEMKKYLLEQLENFDSLVFEEQAEIVEALNLLEDESEFINLTKAFLRKNHLHPLIQSFMVDLYASKSIATTIVINHPQSRERINFSTDNLKTLVDSIPTEEIATMLSEEDSFMEEILFQEATLHYSLAYPFIDEIFPSPTEFVEALLTQDEQSTPVQKTINKFQKYLSELES